MRILHVNTVLHRRGGAEAYAEDVAQLQHAAGHEVTFFGMQHPDNPPYRYERRFPSYTQFEPPPAGPVGKVRSLGRMMWSTSAQRGMDAVLDDFAPDVVHLHKIYHQLSPSVLRPIARRGVPAVMTVHDYKLACPTYRLLDHGVPCTACVHGGPIQAVKRRCHGSLGGSAAAAIEVSLHRVLRAYDPIQALLCPSWFLADVLRSAGVYPDRLAVQEMFVDTGWLTPATGRGRGAVYAGRLGPEKGADVLIRAWGRLAERADIRRVGPTPPLHVAGDGPERERLEHLAAEVAPGLVTFHGRVEGAEVHRLMRAAAVVAVPSLWHENQPMTVLEAFASGRPVVASRLGGLPELIEPDADGVLVPPGDPDALADALAGVLGDPRRAAAMGVRARAKAEHRFAPAAHMAALDDHYAKARAGRGVPA